VTLAERFGANLRRARQRAGISQTELALIAEMHRTAIWQLESGQRAPRLDTLVKLISALECPADDLVEGLRWKSNFKTYGCWEVTEPGARL
jgi:transcriptional regulator with XRE-family HTH domain